MSDRLKKLVFAQGDDYLINDLRRARGSVLKVIEIAEKELGDWASVQMPYAPEWTVPYQDILDCAKEALGILGGEK